MTVNTDQITIDIARAKRKVDKKSKTRKSKNDRISKRKSIDLCLPMMPG
jgi:hypothetical protein